MFVMPEYFRNCWDFVTQSSLDFMERIQRMVPKKDKLSREQQFSGLKYIVGEIRGEWSDCPGLIGTALTQITTC